jgi:glycosyltransferase involved in cell wall biosynthesis
MSDLTLITPSLNSADTLEACIRSVASQSCPAVHLLIDGGSSDGTLEIASRYSGHFQHVSSAADNGIFDALNKGIGLAESEIVGILHADDLLADEQVIESVLDAFSNPEIDAVYGDLDYVERVNPERVVRRWKAGMYSPQQFYQGWMPPHPTFFARRRCFEQFGVYRLDLGTAADYELMLRFLLVHGIRAHYIPRVLVNMRVGGASNVSLNARLKANRMDRKAWAVNGLRPRPWTLLAKPARKIGQWRL